MDLLAQVVDLWLKQVEHCRQSKWKHFGKTAAKAWGFLGKNYRQLYLEQGSDSNPFPDGKAPRYKTRLNKSREFIALMMPYVHAKVPNRLVMPRWPNMPSDVLQIIPEAAQTLMANNARGRVLSYLMNWYLNYLPNENGLYREQRTALPEALVKGRAVLWHTLKERSTGPIPVSTFDTVDHLYIDADCQQMRDAGFIVRKRRTQAWKLARMFEVGVDKIRGQHESYQSQSVYEIQNDDAEPNFKKERDICEWFEIWSRMGIGHRLLGVPDSMKDISDQLDKLGDYVYLAILPGMKHPLNLPPELLGVGPDGEFIASDDEIRARVDWPVAYYEEDENPWPCSVLDFFPNQSDPWASSPLESALPMQEFLDHAYTFLMNRIGTTSRNLVITSTELEEAVDDGLVEGFDLELLKASGNPGVDVQRLIHMLQFPEVNKDFWQVIGLAERAFEQASGMDPLLYGGSGPRQMRSAEEAANREAHLTSRPDDLADCVEEWNSRIAAKEAQAARLYVRAAHIAPLFGEESAPVDPMTGQPLVDEWMMGPLTAAWNEFVVSDDPAEAAAELRYTVEAGSGRRKNKAKQAADATQIVQTLLQPFLQFGMSTGSLGPYRGLMEYMGDAFDMPVDKLLLPDLAPPAMPQNQPPPEDQPPPEEGP